MTVAQRIERKVCIGCGVLLFEKDREKQSFLVLTRHRQLMRVRGVVQGECGRCGTPFSLTTLAELCTIFSAAT